MLNIQEYLINNSINFAEQEFGLRIKEYDDRIVLNYSQTESPHLPTCDECRGLILALDEDFTVLSRGFDRFYNYGEMGIKYDYFSDKHCYEKLDGSFISIYFDEIHQKWQIATRGTAFGEATLMSNENKSYRQLVLEGVGFTEHQFQDYCDEYLDMTLSHLCEIVSPENRIVTPYTDTKLYLLACRNKYTGAYENYGPRMPQIFSLPRVFKFDSPSHCLEASKALKGLEEGYVVYDNTGVPICKIKSPTYVAIHHIRGNNALAPKNLALLVINNEYSEYLTYFPEDKRYISPYIHGLRRMLEMFDATYAITRDNTTDHKSFALNVKSYKESALYFKAKYNDSLPSHEYFSQREKYKLDLLMNYMYNNGLKQTSEEIVNEE